MKATYDSSADALSIDIVEVDGWDGSHSIDETYCHVALAGDRPANVELLVPAEHLDLLEMVAERYGLDLDALRAAAQSALAAADRTVVLEVLASAS